MTGWTIGYGGLLTALGIGGFVATGREHKTALIPAGVGAAALGLGLLARRGSSRKAALVGATAVAGLGLAGSARGLGKLPALLRGEPIERPAAVIAQSIMAGTSAAYLLAAVPSLLRD
ncbi:hypothetical protein [Polyangium jinanense]|uniref:Uncharacterized protein n=1 Tax=Polyangium jinanense TaxID=2829994 RepID=A0A9X3XCR2_9BACT|nr:hypothetical protein [Polyangium jinanense]MDC3960632.1 hypothetical protein [Polyangium jinanense]MDC3986920.1 hypothetical protein [Polyangium jinanense]